MFACIFVYVYVQLWLYNTDTTSPPQSEPENNYNERIIPISETEPQYQMQFIIFHVTSHFLGVGLPHLHGLQSAYSNSSQ